MTKMIVIRFRELLRDRGIQEWAFFNQLQTKINISPTTYNKLLNNKIVRAPLDLIAAICEELDAEISDLFVLVETTDD